MAHVPEKVDRKLIETKPQALVETVRDVIETPKVEKPQTFEIRTAAATDETGFDKVFGNESNSDDEDDAQKEDPGAKFVFPHIVDFLVGLGFSFGVGLTISIAFLLSGPAFFAMMAATTFGLPILWHTLRAVFHEWRHTHHKRSKSYVPKVVKSKAPAKK